MISAEDVIRRIELYFDGGAVRYLTDAERRAGQELGSAPPPLSSVGNPRFFHSTKITG